MAIVEAILRAFGELKQFLVEFFRVTIFTLPNGTRIGLWIFPLVLGIVLGILGIGWFINRR